jgi:hypothetical protein
MDGILAFLTLRPVVTRRVLTAIWYAWLVATAIQVGQYVVFIADGLGRAGPAYHVSLLPPILFALASLALVRVGLEVALRFLPAAASVDDAVPAVDSGR